MKKPALLIFSLLLLSSFWSCEKRKVAKKLEGVWKTVSYTRDTSNMLIRRDLVPVYSVACDTIGIENRRTYEISFEFDRKGKAMRKMKAVHLFADSNSLTATCMPVFRSAEYDSITEGTWDYAEGGNLAITFPGFTDNLKITFNGDREMSWEQVLQVDTGFVKFVGVEKFLLNKID
jgi:hypothetical protein